MLSLASAKTGAKAFRVSKLIKQRLGVNVGGVPSLDCSRDECRNDIYEKTQWAVMSRLTKGIGTDVETALRIARESNLTSQAARQDHEHKIRDLRASLTKREKRTEELQADNSGLKDLLENGRFLQS